MGYLNFGTSVLQCAWNRREGSKLIRRGFTERARKRREQSGLPDRREPHEAHSSVTCFLDVETLASTSASAASSGFVKHLLPNFCHLRFQQT